MQLGAERRLTALKAAARHALTTARLGVLNGIISSKVWVQDWRRRHAMTRLAAARRRGADVHDHAAAVLIQQHIEGLHVAVRPARRVQRRAPLARIHKHAQRRRLGEWPASSSAAAACAAAAAATATTAAAAACAGLRGGGGGDDGVPGGAAGVEGEEEEELAGAGVAAGGRGRVLEQGYHAAVGHRSQHLHLGRSGAGGVVVAVACQWVGRRQACGLLA
jgi:hypothetical protein